MEILSMIADLVNKITGIIFRLSLIVAMFYLAYKMIAEPISAEILVVAFFVLLIAFLEK